MGLADEIRELKELHDNNTLSDEEFARAKAALLSGGPRRRRDPGSGSDTVGAAAKKWVNLQIALAIVGVVLALVFFFGFFLPQWNERREDFDRRWNDFQALDLGK